MSVKDELEMLREDNARLKAENTLLVGAFICPELDMSDEAQEAADGGPLPYTGKWLAVRWPGEYEETPCDAFATQEEAKASILRNLAESAAQPASEPPS